jgi:hypothetical protein
MQDLIERFTTWALDQADVRSAIIVRSQARADRPADKLSDLDLAVIVTDPSIYLFDTTWLREFGEPCLTFVESTAVGIFFASGGSYSETVETSIFQCCLQLRSSKCLNNRFRGNR